MKNQIKIYSSDNWQDYELLDTGAGEKLERFGEYTFARPYEDAVWSKTLSKEWKEATGRFVSSKDGGKGWQINKGTEKKWPLAYRGVKFWAFPTPFRHLGFFPEQASHWDFIEEEIKKTVNSRRANEGVKFLNLFGYTGVASLFALRAGAEVTHLDASKQSLELAKENQNLNPELAKKPMRIILDDAIKFLEREVKRGNRYDAIIMDPPKFGRGPKGEVWKIEEKMPKLLSLVPKVLSKEPLFVILTSYAVDASPLSLGHALAEAMKDFSGNIEQGEQCLIEKSKDRLIALANTAVWKSL